MKNIRPVNPTSVQHLLNKKHDEVNWYFKSLLKTSKTEEVIESYWFPKPQSPGIEKENTHQYKDVFLMKYGNWKRTIKPAGQHKLANQFLSNFDRTDSTLESAAKQAVETLPD